MKKLQRKLGGKTRIPQALDIGLLFYHMLVVQYGQLRELTIAEDSWEWMSKYSYSTCYLASSTKTHFKNTLCLLLGIRKGQETITSAVGKFVHKNHFKIHFVSGLGLFQDASKAIHRDWAFFVLFPLLHPVLLELFSQHCIIFFLWLMTYLTSQTKLQQLRLTW